MCEICLHDPCVPGCPNYQEQRCVFRCSICGYGITEGEEYIENGGDIIHFDCIPSLRWLLNWLGYEIKEAEDFDSYKD